MKVLLYFLFFAFPVALKVDSAGLGLLFTVSRVAKSFPDPDDVLFL